MQVDHLNFKVLSQSKDASIRCIADAILVIQRKSSKKSEIKQKQKQKSFLMMETTQTAESH